jgi:hypothetical protein
MAWTVRLENERGVRETEEFLVIEFGSFPTGKAYPICDMIERAPYYDTLLNPEQVKALIAEIDSAGSGYQKALAPLRNFAQSALVPHIYLRLIGD